MDAVGVLPERLEIAVKEFKIRRVGNSNVVSVPSAFVRGGYEAGQPVVIEQLENGDLLVRRVASHREGLRSALLEAATESRETLEILAAHDRGEPSTLPPTGTRAL